MHSFLFQIGGIIGSILFQIGGEGFSISLNCQFRLRNKQSITGDSSLHFVTFGMTFYLMSVGKKEAALKVYFTTKDTKKRTKGTKLNAWIFKYLCPL